MSQIFNISYIKFLMNSGVNCFLQDNPNNYYKNNIKKKTKITKDISNIQNIEDLGTFINSLKGSFTKFSNNTVMGEGNNNANIMLIGDIPNHEENKVGKPFVGDEGTLLNKMLAAIDINRKNIFLVNIIPWHKVNNNPITNEEIIETLPYIQKYIEIVKPRIILLLGSVATKVILNSNIEIMKLRGEWHEYKTINTNEIIKCLPTFHPSHLLKFSNLKKLSWKDLQKFQKGMLDENL